MKIIPLLISLSLSLALSACSDSKTNGESTPNKSSTDNAQKKQRPATPISVIRVKEDLLVDATQIQALVESGTDAQISNIQAGLVQKVAVKVGDKVRIGDPIIMLKDEQLERDFKQAKLALEQKQNLVQQQNAIHERQKSLFRQNFISKMALEASATELKSRSLAYDLAMQDLKDLGDEQKNLTVRATRAGQIETLSVEAGTYINVGKVIATLSSLRPADVKIIIGQNIATRVKEGQTLEITSAGQTFQTTIERLSISLDPATLTRTAYAKLNFRALTGSSLQARLILAQRNALIIPNQALVTRPAGARVFVIENNKAIETEVKTGLYNEQGIEILEGLQAGQIIALEGAGFLSDNAPVTILQSKNSNKKDSSSKKSRSPKDASSAFNAGGKPGKNTDKVTSQDEDNSASDADNPPKKRKRIASDNAHKTPDSKKPSNGSELKVDPS